MKTIIDYKTVRSSDLDTIDREVNNYIKHGFQPYGEMKVLVLDDRIVQMKYIQTMVRYE